MFVALAAISFASCGDKAKSNTTNDTAGVAANNTNPDSMKNDGVNPDSIKKDGVNPDSMKNDGTKTAAPDNSKTAAPAK